MVPSGGDAGKTRERIERLQAVGATHAAAVTMNVNLPDPQAHIDAIRRFRANVASLMV